MLDLVERKTFFLALVGSCVLFLFFPSDFAVKIILSAAVFYFFFLFFLCMGWASESNTERKYLIGFLVSFFHTFWFFLGSTIGILLVILALKITGGLEIQTIIKEFKWSF